MGHDNDYRSEQRNTADMDWQSIGVFSVPLVIIPFPDCHHPFLCPSASWHQPQHRHCTMGSNHPFHSHSRPRGHGLHYLGLFKATCSTRQEAYNSHIIEVAKWATSSLPSTTETLWLSQGVVARRARVVLRKTAVKCTWN